MIIVYTQNDKQPAYCPEAVHCFVTDRLTVIIGLYLVSRQTGFSFSKKVFLARDRGWKCLDKEIESCNTPWVDVIPVKKDRGFTENMVKYDQYIKHIANMAKNHQIRGF